MDLTSAVIKKNIFLFHVVHQVKVFGVVQLALIFFIMSSILPFTLKDLPEME